MADWDIDRDEAIPKLVELHGGQLYGLGLKLCGDAGEAEDVVQETFLQAYRKWDQFEGRAKPSTWLYTIASRICQRMHRKRSGEPEKMASLQDLLPFDREEIAVAPDPLQEQIKKEAKERVEAAIAELPVTFRMPLVLKDIIGFGVAETAAILGLKPATVKTRVHRARLRLRDALAETLPHKRLPAPAYPRRVCLDLLDAKQEALDRGAPFPHEVICDRCQAVFASLDLAQDVCASIGAGALPGDVKERLLERLSAA